MKVSEEIDALVSMGFDPVRWLVLPRCLRARRHCTALDLGWRPARPGGRPAPVRPLL